MRRNIFIFFLMLVPFGVFSQIVISGNGQLLRYNAANIRVGGNWTNNATGTGYTGVNATGGVVFVGSSPQLINGTTVTTFQNLGISNTAGVSTVGIDVDVVALTFFDGIITIPATFKMNIPDGGTMNPGKTTSFVNGTVAKTGTDAFTFEIGNGTKWAPIEISAPSTITDVFEATYFLSAAPDQANIPANIELVSGFEYWGLEQTNGSSTLNVTLHWKNSQESEIGVALGNLFIVHHDGGTAWDVATNGGTTGAGDLNSVQSGSITGTSFSSFKYFTFGSDNSTLTPLPVELLYFNANIDQYAISINWATASEQNSDYFDIEKSTNGVDWESIDRIQAQGNSSSLVNYEHIDQYPFLGNQYYRLKQVDFDGSTSYSDIIIIDYDNILSTNIEIYPNPSKDFTTIIGRKTELDNLRIFTTIGRDVTYLVYIDRLTENRAYLNLSQLTQGQYIIKTKSSVSKILME